MTEKQLRTLCDAWIARLGLGHWTIEVVVEKLKPRTTSMRTTKSPHYDRGRIIVQPWVIRGQPPADWHPAPGRTFARVIEETIVHVLWETSSAICLLAKFSKASAYSAAVTVQEHQEEGFVDRLSVALVKGWEAA